jgi:hypothetical protein
MVRRVSPLGFTLNLPPIAEQINPTDTLKRLEIPKWHMLQVTFRERNVAMSNVISLL